ncbi:MULTISPECIES: ABC transporter permease [Sphingobium]|uniref:Capsular polysaccharide transport system permease protein n=1 Tax=Sphingobium lignivorans TaxID=2735886 RepID=A0ABR6NCM2_9SPHN|nr:MULTISPECIES: ABC transporter permease [Sphingobium]MBB5985018.1 capsular polysaccharide transport system permease protein [Sphingobium lignivorans]BAK65688.1 putative capsule polysaccharide export inner-membrane protein [Sphingobium sp. SYK-6]
MADAGFQRLQSGWATQVRVIHALMIRELHTRFGRENIGFLWIMVEPLLFAILVAIVWRFIKGPEEHGVSIVAFVISGYIPITLFRHGVSRSTSVFTANSSLLYHRQIKILDFILVRFAIEVLGGMMAYLFIALILIPLQQFPIPADIGLFIAGWFTYAIFCFSLCLVIGPLSEMSEVVEKFVPVTTYIMIPISGLFTMASWVPPPLRDYLLYSPFVNAMEMMRKGLWGDQVTAYYSIWNPIGCSMVAAAIGLALCRRVRRTLTVE